MCGQRPRRSRELPGLQRHRQGHLRHRRRLTPLSAEVGTLVGHQIAPADGVPPPRSRRARERPRRDLPPARFDRSLLGRSFRIRTTSRRRAGSLERHPPRSIEKRLGHRPARPRDCRDQRRSRLPMGMRSAPNHPSEIGSPAAFFCARTKTERTGSRSSAGTIVTAHPVRAPVALVDVALLDDGRFDFGEGERG